MKHDAASCWAIVRFSTLPLLPLLLGATGGCTSDVQVGHDQDPLKTDGGSMQTDAGSTQIDSGSTQVDAGSTPTSCTMADCADKPVRDDAKVCPDGSTVVRSVCARNTSGVCDWDFPACPAPVVADAGCGCVPDISWGPDGGFVAYVDGSSITACFDYVHSRTSHLGDPPLSCKRTLLGCGSGLRSGRDIVAVLDRADVKEAIAKKTILYGTDPRAFDGQVFRIEVGGARIEVGGPCGAQGACTPTPAGVSMLADLLRAIDAQELGFEPCKSMFPQP